MNTKKIAILSLVIFSLAIFIDNMIAYSGGTSGGYSGAPGEANCAQCHGSFPLNSGSAGFAIQPSAPTLVGATNLSVQVAFTNSSMPRHGFELTLRDSMNNAAGTWTITDTTNTRLGNSSHVVQTRTGANQQSWSADWTPPATLPAGPLTFYSSGIDANGSGTSGDYAYTTSTTIYQAEVATANTTWPLGTTQAISISAPTRPNDFYVLAISDSTNPTPLGGAMILPVDLGSPLFNLVLLGVPLFQNFYGTLDASGNAQAAVILPNLPFLSGMQWHFAFATLNLGAQVTEVSNRISVSLQ